MSLTPQLVLFEQEHKKIVEVAERLARDANAKAIFLVDKNGQLVAEAGELKGIDTTSLASLVAGNIAATAGLAKILGEDEFPIHFHQGKRDNVHITLVAQRAKTREPEHDLMPYAVEVVAVDQTGIVHQIAQFFAQRRINIEDLYSGNYAAAHTGTPMFSLHMTISIPIDISIAALRNEFMDFCDQLNLDAIMEPVK